MSGGRSRKLPLISSTAARAGSTFASMKTMLMTLAGAFFLSGTGALLAGGEGWTTDYEAAKKEAAKDGKSVLIDFTGSDWCGWCIKLNDEVFKHDTFKNGVKDKFVLLELDYPQDKSKQTETVIKQNEQLAEKYAVQGYPTILLADEQGRPFAATGYKAGGPGNYVSHLDELLAKRKVRDESFAKAEKLQGPEKAAVLVAALDAMELEDGMVDGFYASTVEDIKKSDPDDTTGFGKKLAVKARMEKFGAALNELAGKKDFDGALVLIEKELKEGGMDKESTQQVTFMKALVYAEQGKFDDALKVAEEVRTIAPESELSANLDNFKQQIQGMKSGQ